MASFSEVSNGLTPSDTQSFPQLKGIFPLVTYFITYREGMANQSPLDVFKIHSGVKIAIV